MESLPSSLQCGDGVLKDSEQSSRSGVMAEHVCSEVYARVGCYGPGTASSCLGVPFLGLSGMFIASGNGSLHALAATWIKMSHLTFHNRIPRARPMASTFTLIVPAHWVLRLAYKTTVLAKRRCLEGSNQRIKNQEIKREQGESRLKLICQDRELLRD